MIHLFIAALMFAATATFGSMSHSSIEDRCQQQYPDAVDACINDKAFGVDMLNTVGFLVALGFLVLGVSGVLRRRRAASARRRPTAPRARETSTSHEDRSGPRHA